MKMNARSGKAIALAIAFVGCFAILFFFDPARQHFLPPCPFRALTGLLCPGCGSTRALHQLLHGNFLAALRLNPLMVISLPFLCFSSLFHMWQTRKSQHSAFARVDARWIWLLLVAILLFGILRNVPMYPFSLMTP